MKKFICLIMSIFITSCATPVMHYYDIPTGADLAIIKPGKGVLICKINGKFVIHNVFDFDAGFKIKPGYTYVLLSSDSGLYRGDARLAFNAQAQHEYEVRSSIDEVDENKQKATFVIWIEDKTANQAVPLIREPFFENTTN